MNRIRTALIALTLGGLWTFSILPGCRTVATPTFPATNTPVLTSTPTFTSTPVLTSTPTFTKTNTPTITNTGTFTFSPTVGSPTNTPTITSTPTATATATITNTPGAPTSTSTPCTAASIQATYTFESSTDCMHVDASNTIIYDSGLSTTQAHSGTKSYFMAINNTTGGASNAQFEVTYSTPQDFTGAAVTLYIYLDAGLTGAAGFQVADQNGGCSWDSTWVNAPGTGSWLQVTFAPSTTSCGNASTPSNVTQLVFQLTGVPNGASGNLYVDDLTITLPGVPPTATPTGCVTAPTFNSTYPFIWNNDNYCALPSGWSTNNNGGTITVPSLVLSNAQNYTVACSSNCGSLLAGSIPFTAANQSANIEYVFPSGTTGTDITGKTISCYYYLDATPSNGGYGQMYIQDSATYDYQSLGFGGTYALTTGAWTPISIPANQGGVNPAKIWKFGVQIGTGSSATSGFQSVNLYIDDMTIQ